MSPEFDIAYEQLRYIANLPPGGRAYLPASSAHVLLMAINTWRDKLLRIAARDYSKEDILAHVADAFGVSVAELERMVE